MAQYIDKDDLVREIEKQRNAYISEPSKYKVLSRILSFIDTLEVKEVDVEKESELIANSIMISVQANLYHTNVYDYEKRCYKHSDLKDAARKGIELSLKTQKGE